MPSIQINKVKTSKTKELKILKTILWTYIILCFIIAGLNFGYVSRAPVSTANFIKWLYAFYENWIKTLLIIICSFLTLRIIGNSKVTIMRKRNLIGFIIAALVVHIVSPLLLNNPEIYYFTMPLPWTTTPLQLLYSNSPFYINNVPILGVTGITTVLIFYVCYSVIVILGTLLLGRRWQCSTLCLFNGFAAEVCAPAFPLVGKNKKVTLKTLKVFSLLRWIFLALSIIFLFYWLLILSGIISGENVKIVSKIETYKYLSSELLMTIFFWIAFIGRGYCYYCPLGTVIGLLGKAAGQEITTNNTKCIQCSQCNTACQMSIDIKSKAKDGTAVTDLRCVGCGHCIDACPTRTLSYSTKFLNKASKHFKIFKAYKS